ncbi:MAG TPA: DUF4097 family beta strand repeat-containing protein [Polyangiaceae bacterium]|nr:DUF4097 family beta strand repeat-containing protein [Polyangiaceae bacterium]
MSERRNLGFLLGVLGLTLAGCSFHEPNLHTEQLDIRQVPSSLVVDVGAGDVWLRGRHVETVFVTAKIDGPTNHVGYELGDDSLTVFDDCNEEPCSVDLSLDVPENLALTLRTGSGDVSLTSLRGDISLRTGSGDVVGSDLAGLNFSAETGSGDARLELSPARRVHVQTGSGDVSLTVPSGAYHLDVSTGSGDQALRGVSNDASAPDRIDVSTGSGDLKITGI